MRPNLAAISALAMADAIFLGGSCLAQIYASGLHVSAGFLFMKHGIF